MTKKKCDGCSYHEITGEHISPCGFCYKYYKKNEGDEK